jgi:septum formation protein
LAIILASAKAEDVLKDNPGDLVIAADTFAVMPSGERLHKPVSSEDAIELCLQQSGKKIYVITGLAMAYGNRLITNTSVTEIEYIEFDRATITKLLESDDATIRNSGLGFFIDAPGFTLVKSFNGSYTGAMGLPMEIVRENLTVLGYKN